MASEKDDLTQQTTQTVAKTLWSETLIDLLIVALQKNQSDEKISGLLKELQQKNFKKDYIIDKIDRAMGDVEARRVRSLLAKL